MEPALAGALYTAESLVEGAFAVAKGILYPTLPLKATLSRIAGVALPRAHHSISVVKGRAYIFGGKVSTGEWAGNDMDVVILPSSGVQEADYLRVPARAAAKGQPGAGEVPEAKVYHSAVVVGDEIYIFGGRTQGGKGEQQHEGRVWVFDTVSNTWSYLDPPPNSPAPSPRYLHAAASSEEPRPKEIRTDRDIMPQQPPDPAKFVPDPPAPDSFGTLFVYGGKTIGSEKEGEELLNDAWAFDIRSRTWCELPQPPGPARRGASLAVTGDRLYRFGGYDGENHLGGGIDWLEVAGVWKYGERGTAFGDLALSSLIGDWTGISYEDGKGPRARNGAGLIDVTTGQGRNYLLLVGGEAGRIEGTGDGNEGASADSSTEQPYCNDVWAFQLPPANSTAASVKDATRTAIKRDTHEAAWAEVEYQYLTEDGDIVPKQLPGAPGMKGIGSRAGFASAKGTEVDGSTAVVWGGLDPEMKILGDGWLITVDR